MEEVENQSQSIEVTPQETKSNEEVSEQAVQALTPVEDRRERDWKAVKRKQQELERELRMQRELNERLLQMTQPVQKQEVDEIDTLSDEEFIPKGKVKKLVQKEKAKIVQDTVQEVEKILKQREDANYEARLQKQFSDYDEVVNPETLSLLETQDPELAQTIVDLKDPYKIGMTCYKYIKAQNLSAKVPEVRRAKEVDKKLAENAKTVQTPQAYDKRPMAQAFKMTEEEKSKLYQEMHHYASQAGFSY